MIEWQWSSYPDLSKDDLFEVLKLRQEVFIIEQNCPYPDADHLDRQSWHLLGWLPGEGQKQLAAYLRLVPPGLKFNEPSLGRVVTSPVTRRQGMGKALMEKALLFTEQAYPQTAIRISAQCYLEMYYSEFGFAVVSQPYEEDGIPHLEMLRPAAPIATVQVADPVTNAPTPDKPQLQVTYQLSPAHIEQLHQLYQQEWWSRGRSLTDTRECVHNSQLVIGVVDNKQLVGFARVLTDQIFKAMIFDVIVERERRQQGLGALLMTSIKQHPLLSKVKHFELYCLPELIPFYEANGFSLEEGGLHHMRFSR